MATAKAQIRSANLPTARGGSTQLPSRLAEDGALEAWTQRLNDPNSLIALDLFCGAGGMSLGFEDAGFTIAAGIDADPMACATHAANVSGKTVCLDLGAVSEPLALLDELQIPRVDVVIGGPPCQGFSVAGLSKLRSLQARDPEVKQEIDARNALYKEFVDFVRAIRPMFFVMENVPHLSFFGQGIIAAEIRRDFEAIGYHVDDQVLDASHFGVPQVRRRLFFVGSRVGHVWRPPRAAFRARPRTLQDAIGDLPPVSAPALEECLAYTARIEAEYQELMRGRVPAEQQGVIYDHVVRPVREDDRQIFQLMRPGQNYRDVPEEFRRYRSDSFGDKYYRLRWDAPGNTITAHMAKDGYRYIHPEQLRTLSVREAARVQSFPDHFRFAGFRSNRYRQIGNAVPPLLARAVGQSLARAIRRYRQIAGTEHVIAYEISEEGDAPWQLGLPGFEYLPDLRLAGYIAETDSDTFGGTVPAHVYQSGEATVLGSGELAELRLSVPGGHRT